MARRYHRKRKSSASNELVFIAGIVVVALLLKPEWLSGTALAYLLLAIALIVAGIVAIIIVRRRAEKRKLHALDIAAIDSMDPLEFEKYVAQLLHHRGFSKIKLTERYDYGVDILAYKDGIMWGVQVKRYHNMVKAEAVRQVFTALTHYKCDRAIVITNSTYSRPARELATDNNCILIDRDVLAGWIVEFQKS